MTLEAKRAFVLEALKNAQNIEDKSNIVVSILECIRDGYMKVDIDTENGQARVIPLSEKENFIVQEMDNFIKSLKEN